MSQLVRRAGRARLDDGTLMLWSVADGRRGRRWRAMASRDDRIVESFLLEVDGDGRPTRLEVTNDSGLLTLHPGPSGMLHGNAVTPAGMRHLALGWGDDHELAIDRLPIADAVTARRLARLVPVGEGREVDVVEIAVDLEASAGRRHWYRVAEGTWRVDDGKATRHVAIDATGIPIWPDGGAPAEWALELDPGG